MTRIRHYSMAIWFVVVCLSCATLGKAQAGPLPMWVGDTFDPASSLGGVVIACDPSMQLGPLGPADGGTCAVLAQSKIYVFPDLETTSHSFSAGGEIEPLGFATVSPGPFTAMTGPAKLRNGKNALFAAFGGSFASYNVVDASGNPFATIYTKDTRRATCSLDEVGGISLQLKAKSNTAFQSQDDLIFVITQDGCSDTSHNRIIAFNASDGTVAWFNGGAFNDGAYGGTYNVGPAYSSCLVDYDRNQLYCTTLNDGPVGSSTEMIWALDTSTGNLKWRMGFPASYDETGIYTPILANNRLYLLVLGGDDLSHIYALDPDTGVQQWDLTVPNPTVGNLAADTHSGDPHWLFVSSNTISNGQGVLFRITDNGSSAVIDGAISVADHLSSGPAVIGDLGEVWVGSSVGDIYGYDILGMTCVDNGCAPPGESPFNFISRLFDGTGPVGVDSLVADRSDPAGPEDRLMARDLPAGLSSDALMARFNLAPGQADLDLEVGSPPPVQPGGAISYTLTVTNQGPQTATDVKVTFAPSGVTVNSIQPSQGLADLNLGEGYDPSIVQLLGLEPGASATIVISATANQQTGSFTDTATVSADEQDPDHSNNSVVVTTIVSNDTTPPISMISQNPVPTANGWNSQDVTLTIQSNDDVGGSGVKEITYTASGADNIGTTTIESWEATLVDRSEGATNIVYFATDNTGNIESPHSYTVRLDKTAPALSCRAADGLWHATDVSIACTGSDPLSGLLSSSNATFSLSTSVPAGTETNNASTGSQTVCDNAGNCATAGPVNGNKVDKKAPAITLTTPPPPNSTHPGPTYLLNQSVAASYSCSDGGSGVATCAGPVGDGSSIATGSVGLQNFLVHAADNVGNQSKVSTSYAVSYKICLLYDPTRAVHSGGTIPIRLELCDAGGTDVSALNITVSATGLTMVSSTTSGLLGDTSPANPDSNFRYDATLGTTGGYIFNLSTMGLQTGTYRLSFIAGADPTVHALLFQVQ